MPIPVDAEVKRREPTEGEKANGWTADTLADYLAERRNQQIAFVAKKKPRVPVVESYDGFNPYKW